MTIVIPRPARLFLLTACAFMTLRSTQAQDWIWMGREAGENDIRFFRKPFHLADAPAKAVLSLTCDNRAAIVR